MTLYQGRISSKPDALMDAINRSLPIDIRLLAYDLETNRAWSRELNRLGVLSDTELKSVLGALDEIQKEAQQGAFYDIPDDEDVHTLVERLVTEKIGETGGRIHTGRSRNDQVVCDLRMYTCDKLIHLTNLAANVVQALRDVAEQHAETIFSGTTHLQPAQPITLGHFLLSLAFALLRDIERLSDTYARTNFCPLGSGALAGSGFEVDRQKLAKELGFEGTCPNAMDAISDRDFVQEAASACASICVHLSRYAEQFIIWSNPSFGYVRFSDDWSTGSSMMPQKRNPDAMELIRGKSARCIGNVSALFSLTKGLPLSYAKDLQEDKELLFDSLDTADLCLQVFERAVASATFRPDKMKAAMSGDLLATELADALVEKKIPFRKAHERVAEFVGELEKDEKTLSDATQKQLTKKFPELGDEFKLSFEGAVARRTVLGGASPQSVRSQIIIVDQVLQALYK